MHEKKCRRICDVVLEVNVQLHARSSAISCRFARNSKSSERAVALLFGMAESTPHGIIKRVASFLESISGRIIHFLLTAEQKAVLGMISSR